MNLLTNTTSLMLWQDVVREAENICSVTLHKNEEAYLVTLLNCYANKPEVVTQIMAKEFMRSLQFSGKQRIASLQKVGDQCLLFSGLFPQLANKRHVKISYYVDIGQSAYASLSHTTNDLYSLLATHFVGLMDILQSIRQNNHHTQDLLPLQAYEQWSEVGSQRALTILQKYTSALPLKK